MVSELFAYTVTAHKRGDKSNRLRMDKLDATDGSKSGSDVLAAFDAVVKKGVEWPPPPAAGQDDTRETISRVETVTTPKADPRVRYGRVRVTRAAIRHDVEQAGTGNTIAIQDEDREGRPLFFWFVAPAGLTNALLLTERRQRFGIVSGFWANVLLARLKSQFSGATSELNYFVPNPVWEQYKEKGGGIEGLVLQRVMAEDREDRELDEPTRRKAGGLVTLQVDRSVLPARQKVADVFRKGDKAQAIELVVGDTAEAFDSEQFDTVKMKVVIDGKRRTVVIGKDRVPQIGYPVTGVRLDNEGYPKADDMAKFATNLARGIGRPIGIR